MNTNNKKNINIIGILSAAFLLICKFIIHTANFIDNGFFIRGIYSGNSDSLFLLRFDVIAVVLSAFIFINLIINAIIKKNILKYVICFIWLVSAVFSSVFLRNYLMAYINYAICAQIGTALSITFVILISLDMILRSKSGKIAGSICLIVYIALQILERALLTASNYVVLSTFNIAIPVYILVAYFVVPDKKLTHAE